MNCAQNITMISFYEGSLFLHLVEKNKRDKCLSVITHLLAEKKKKYWHFYFPMPAISENKRDSFIARITSNDKSFIKGSVVFKAGFSKTGFLFHHNLRRIIEILLLFLHFSLLFRRIKRFAEKIFF